MNKVITIVIALLAVACSGSTATESDDDMCPRFVSAICFEVDRETCDEFLSGEPGPCYETTLAYVQCLADQPNECADLEVTCVEERLAAASCS